MSVITENKIIDEICQKLANEPFIAIDTEFLRDRYYYPKLCLIQIAAGDDCYIIDPLATNIDLSPVWKLFTNPKVVKVIHSARQDVETIYHMTGDTIYPIFDTQIAALTLGDTSISYAAMVMDFLGIKLDKSNQFSEWDRRPLSSDQLEYARTDVIHLNKIYPTMKQKLEQQNRLHWIYDELAILEDKNTYNNNPENAWQRIQMRDFSEKNASILQALACWREIESQENNLPRNHILKDNILVEIANKSPRNINELYRIYGTKYLNESQAKNLLGTILNAKNIQHTVPLEQTRGQNMNSHEKFCVEIFKIILHIKSLEHKVSEKLIASANDLREYAVANNPNLPFMSGWRYDIFGKYIHDAKHGKVALKINNGKIEIV